MKLTAKLLKKLIQEEIELGNFKDRLEAAKEKLEKLYGIKPETEDDLDKILQIMDGKIMSYHDFSQQADPSRYRAYYNDAFSKLPGAKEYDKVKGHLKSSLQEDGHEDVSSARRKLKTTIEDASEILQSLESTPEQELPSWWMSKITIVGEYINKARDYLLVSGDTMTEVDIGPGDQTIQGLEPQHDEENRVDRMRQKAIELIYEMSPKELERLLKQINPYT